MAFKFEKLDVWDLALAYIDVIYGIADQLPQSEEYNLKSQMKRAATSVALNIAEGSTGQTDVEQARFIGLAIRSLVETVACLHIFNAETLQRILTHCVTHTAKQTSSLRNYKAFAVQYLPNRNGYARMRLNTILTKMYNLSKHQNNGRRSSLGGRQGQIHHSI